MRCERERGLAAAAGMTRQSMGELVRELGDLGLVEMVPDPDDRRAQALTLTDEGRTLLLAIRDDRDRWMQGLLADWDPDDVAQFSTHLRHFAKDLENSLTTLTSRTTS